MASLTLITPTRSKLTPPTTTISATAPPGRCQFITLFATVLLFSVTAATPAFAASNEGYIKETEEVRVVRLWEIPCFEDKSQTYTIEMVFVDSQVLFLPFIFVPLLLVQS
ncbi:hypothetical protein LguiB_033626 [Lonicera macranthoides]